MNIVERAKNILISPKTEWEVIKNEQSTVADLFTKYALILALIPVIAGFIGQSLVGISFGPIGSFKVPVVNGLIYAVLYYVLTLAGIYLVAIIVDALAPSFGAQKDMVGSLKVVVYSYTAAWVAGIFQILPMLAILSILGLYSLYLLYLGLNIVKGSPADKVFGYTAVVVIITIVVYFVIGAIVGAIALGGLMMGTLQGM